MYKRIIFLFLLICPAFLFAQQKSPVRLISSTSATVDTKTNITYIKNPVFQQDNATLSCDSALFYTKRNYFEAYNNVHINQLATNISSDQLQYDGNKHHAHLTGNVIMTDPTTTLTTNILDYNTQSKLGTYITGGKIQSQDVTVTSKNGWYFTTTLNGATTNDAYFRYNVVVVTPQTTITSDTLRYNIQSKWTYFYGPTNIKGKDDNLYTENGAYNTLSEDAYFGKKNLYTQGTRSLKGDSLFYYGKKGIGKAVRNIVFRDTKDKMEMKGDLGYYYKLDQRTLVTKNAVVGLGTQDSIMINNKKRPDTLWMGADTLETQMVLQKTLTLIPKISIKADNQVGEDEEGPKEPKIDEETNSEEIKKAPLGKKPKVDKKQKNKNKTEAKTDEDATLIYKEPTDSTKIDSLRKNIPKVIPDSLKNKADSVIKNIPKAKTDSLQKTIAKNANVSPKDLAKVNIPKGTEKDVKNLAYKAIKGVKSGILKPDTTKFNPADTVQARVIKAYHGVKIYKTNIQAKTDSLFYTSADSTLRCFQNPVIWSEGSQQIADTIYVQFKKNKLNNLQAIRNAFLVNTPKDSLRFNQIKGRLMTGFFKDGRLKNLYVDGNAESIYYTQDDSTKVYKEMNQTLSSRIKFIFKDKENDISDIVYIKAVEGALNPENKIASDHVLKGFSWKPTERPKSKKDAIGSSGKAKPKTKTPAKVPAKTPVTTAKPTVKTKVTTEKNVVVKNDSIQNPETLKQVLKVDSTAKDLKPDSVKVEQILKKQ